LIQKTNKERKLKPKNSCAKYTSPSNHWLIFFIIQKFPLQEKTIFMNISKLFVFRFFYNRKKQRKLEAINAMRDKWIGSLHASLPEFSGNCENVFWGE
jgi:hypothetical protein